MFSEYNIAPEKEKSKQICILFRNFPLSGMARRQKGKKARAMMGDMLECVKGAVRARRRHNREQGMLARALWESGDGAFLMAVAGFFVDGKGEK